MNQTSAIFYTPESKPLVSVVVIVYNQAEYIVGCLDSIFSQDYENIEVIVSDDASTDGTDSILTGIKERYPNKIRLNLALTNGGITKNANAGLALAQGKYIAMFAGDDLMLPGRITKQVEFLERHPEYSICGSYVQIIDANGRPVRIQKDQQKKARPTYTLRELIASNNSLAPVPGFMVRADCVPAGGYDYRLPKAADSLFYYHIASKGDLYILKEPLTSYRVHESHASKMGYFDDSLVAMALCEYKFPEMYFSVRKGRGNLYYSQARYFHKIKKDYHKALKYIAISFMGGLSIKKIAELLLIIFKVDK